MKQTIVLAGATGFIGRWIIEEFQDDYQIIALSRKKVKTNPNKNIIRRDPVLYNIFDSRNEGVATAVEEMFMQLGLYENSQRSKEIVYILIAQRAARGLGSLYAHANLMTMEEAGKIHSEFTPRGWMKTEKELLIFEQHLYLRQPGYGTSYITGKYLFENALSEYSRLNENVKTADLKNFFRELINIGNIPMTLFQWEINNDWTVLEEIVPGLN